MQLVQMVKSCNLHNGGNGFGGVLMGWVFFVWFCFFALVCLFLVLFLFFLGFIVKHFINISDCVFLFPNMHGLKLFFSLISEEKLPHF